MGETPTWHQILNALWREVDAEQRESSTRRQEYKLRTKIIRILKKLNAAKCIQAIGTENPIRPIHISRIRAKLHKKKLYPPSWSAAIKARDGACTECGLTKKLHAHHIEPVHTRPDLATELSNGITLCVVCHAAKHPYISKFMLRASKR